MTLLQERIQTGQSLIEWAETAYAQGDLELAVDKAWESARHAVGSIAQRRGWTFDTPGEMHSVADMLSKETDKGDIYTLFVVAFIAPYNFNEGWTDNAESVEYDLLAAKKLLALLEDIE